MVLSEFERAAGMREFPLRRERYRVVVFTGPKGWEIHHTDAKGRSIDSYLLSFSDVKDRLSDLPNSLAEAKRLEEGRLAKADGASG